MKMSHANQSEKCGERLNENSSGSEEAYETDEEEGEDKNVCQALKKLKNVYIERNYRLSCGRKSHEGRLNVSLRYSRRNRLLLSKNRCQKYIKKISRKTDSVKSQTHTENSVESPQKGKRCRLGGKAKGLPPKEEITEKCDSDEDADSFYLSRISLGYFQKFRDKSGASTSYQLEENYKGINVLVPKTEEVTSNTSEELELLELQEWGVTDLVSSCKNIEKINRVERVEPDTF